MTDIIGEIEAAVVPVRIKADNRKNKKRYLRTTLHCYSVDNVNQPTALVAPYNPRRFKVVITPNDTQVIITQDNPSQSTQTDTTAIPPAGASIRSVTAGTGFNGHTIYGPDNVWAVSITGNGAARVNVVQHIWCYDD